MFIWFIMAIVLVVIVAGGFGGRHYARRNSHPDATHAHKTRKHPTVPTGAATATDAAVSGVDATPARRDAAVAGATARAFVDPPGPGEASSLSGVFREIAP